MPPHTIVNQYPTEYKKIDSGPNKGQFELDSKGNKIPVRYKTVTRDLPGYHASDVAGNGYADREGNPVGYLAGDQQDVGPGMPSHARPDPSRAPRQQDGPRGRISFLKNKLSKDPAT